MSSLAQREQLVRLADFVDGFAGCFGRHAQRSACRFYVTGLLSASERKSIQAMAGGRSDAEYQRVHHFIADAPWDARALWKRLRARLPERRGVVVVDDTGFHKQGNRSVGVARQYCPPLGKVANCQVAVTSILRTDRSTWPLAMDLYMPDEWIEDDARREIAFVPPSIVAKKKWELALAQIARSKREGFEITGVAADAGYGDVAEFRDGIAKLGLRYVVRVSGRQTIFRTRPTIAWKRNRSGDRRRTLAKGSTKRETIKELAESLPGDAFRRITWGKGSKGPLRIRVAAVRVRLGAGWDDGKPTKECWVLVRRKRDGTHKLYVSNLPSSASLLQLVQIAYSRWAVEQSYQQLKDDLGFDHFEGRSWPGWNHHAVLTAMALVFLGIERRRSRRPVLPTIPSVRRVLSRLTQALSIIEDPEMKDLLISFARDPPRF